MKKDLDIMIRNICEYIIIILFIISIGVTLGILIVNLTVSTSGCDIDKCPRYEICERGDN